MATPALWRTEQQANTGTADIPGIFDPQIIGLSNGNILVAWSEFGTSGVGVTAGIDIIGKIYAGDGITVVRDSYRINQTRNVHEESDYDIAATNDGGFILVYVDNDGVDSRVVWERKNAIGNNIYSRDIVSETGAGDYDNPQIAVSSSSNASYVTFTDLQLPVGVANNDDISGVRLNSVGTVITSEFDAAENTADDFRDADTAINTNGELVTVHRNIDASEIVIEVRSLAGVLQHRTMVDNTGNPTDPQIATLSNGNIAVTWRDDADDVNYAVYNSNLDLVQVGTSIDNSLAQQPEIAALPNGEFVIIWYETNGIISGRKYNSDGTADGAAFTINTGAATSPNIGVTGDGRLLITWEEGDNVSFEIWDPRDGNILAGTYDTPPLNFVAGGDIYSKVGGSTIVGDNGAPDNIIGDDGGVDFIYGNNGDDTINGYGGNDIIFGGSGNDSILGGAGVDSIFGDTGNDTIISSSGRDNVIAGAGDDLIILGADDYMDSVNGGDGNDTLDHSGVGIGLFGGFYDAYINFDTGILTDIVGFTATITNIETYIDNDGGNRIVMGGDLRVVEAMGGDDTISARTGAVTIDAGAGNDLVNATSGDSHLYDGGAGTDTIDLTYYTGNYQFNMTTGATGFLKTFLNFENAITESGNDSITGNAAANEITTSDGDDTIIGLGGDDRLNGGAGNDLLDGGAGLDTVIYNNTSSDLVIDLSLSGMQTISADMGNDTFVSIEGIMTSVGNDLLIGNAANNVIFSNMGNDSIYGGDGNDTLTSSWGNNFINGEVGNDSLTGGYGSDTINGGDGNDLIDAYVFGISSQQDVLNGDAGNDTIFASTNNDLVNGGTGDDSLDGNAGNDDIFGGDGNDYMDGSAGDDSLEGNDGNDVMRGGIGNDLFNGGGGFDTADYSDATTDLVANINFVGAQTVSAMMGIDTYVSIEGLTGGSGNDLLVGSAVGNVIDGGAGNDEIYGIGGGDILRGGSGNDQIEGSGGNDTMEGGDGSGDILNYFNSAGGVTVNLRFQGTAQSVGGFSGTDVFTNFEDLYGSNAGADILVGSASGNRILGFDGADQIFGFHGDDTLIGMQGNDTLTGGQGADIMSGGNGADIFAFNDINESNTTDRDRINDFGIGGAEFVDLSTIDANTSTMGNQAFNFIGSAAFAGAGDLRFATNGTNGFVLGDVDGDGSIDLNIMLMGITSMNASDFIL